MVTLLPKASHKEQSSVIYFLWVKGLGSNAIHSRCVQSVVTIVLLDKQTCLV